jgi:bifunctional DNase/RNase
MTHDLMKTMLDELAVQVQRVLITELREGTFYAVIELAQNGTPLEISSRPSDAIALGVRLGVPIFADEEVLSEASIVIREDEVQEEEVQKFRQFLENVKPEDFTEG